MFDLVATAAATVVAAASAGVSADVVATADVTDVVATAAAVGLHLGNLTKHPHECKAN